MLLLLLRDGSHIELTQATDVIHKLGSLVCVDRLDLPVMTFPVSEVLAYTHNDKLVEELLAGNEDTETYEVRHSTRRRANRSRRRSNNATLRDGSSPSESLERVEHTASAK